MPLPPCPPTPGSAAISSPCRHGQRRQAQEHQRGANRGQGVEDAAAAVRDEAVAKRAARRQWPRRWRNRMINVRQVIDLFDTMQESSLRA